MGLPSSGNSPGGRAPAIISGALECDQSDTRGQGIRGRGLSGVKKEVVDVRVDLGVE